VTFDIEFEIEGLVTPAVGAAYVQADVQLDDYSFAKLANDKVQLVYDARDPTDDDDDVANDDGLLQSSFDRYFRFDGANDGELVYGSSGVDYSTSRLGNDTVYGYEGNDRLIGAGGADYQDGGDGNDIFEIASFGSGTSGTSNKSDDGKAEWIVSASAAAANSFRAAVTNGVTNATDYGNKIDVIVGGKGTDTLRVTAGIGATSGANGTVVLNDANFQKMERVEVGGHFTIVDGSRLRTQDRDESSFQQLRDGHLYFGRSSTVSDTSTSAGGSTGNSINNVVIDASGVTKNGLTFEGNANTQRFIGTAKADVLIGNEGVDTLTGAGGADKFVFQTVREYQFANVVDGVIAYTPSDEAFDATDADVITDFTTGSDKIVFRVEGTTTLEDTFDSLVALTKGNLTSTNVEIGDITASLDTAGSATSFIKADTTGSDIKVYYDADGSGAGAAVLIATLTNISTVGVSDFRVEAVQGF